MIDFQNGTVIKLMRTDSVVDSSLLSQILIDSEIAVCQFKAMRDGVIFTNRRIITVNIQGLTGKKKDFTSIPYARIHTYSIETAGVFDMEGELKITMSEIGTVTFEFSNSKDLFEINKVISQFALR